MTSAVGLRLSVRGTVQGVGFRPFVFQLAEQHSLTGWVRNTSGQVEIEVDGEPAALELFTHELRTRAPPLARIDEITTQSHDYIGYEKFAITSSTTGVGSQSVPPDIATCDDCLRELLDPADRRYNYPFINCTNCGPRFTIIEALPYDRPHTTMRTFALCADCRREYDDPRDRRFHAQPIACPVCGPKLWLQTPAESCVANEDALAGAVRILHAGGIVAIKGLGGFQLACAAENDGAVQQLRQRKQRYAKPYALMVADVAAAQAIAQVTPEAVDALLSRERPIVLLERKPRTSVAVAVAPRMSTLGIMLPSTPLHHLLLRAFGGPLVMTSGNLSEEPIAIGNDEAVDRLGGIADAWLLHDRDIYSRYDDSVLRPIGRQIAPIRRARGFAPAPIRLPFTASRDIIALGAQQKNTFCLATGANAYVSQHIGELDNLLTSDHYRQTLDLYLDFFHARPGIVAHDLHPDYISSAFARNFPGEDLIRIGVQHHHAHVVSCMAEHHLEEEVIGVAYDGTGLGLDGAVWGGEIMTASWQHFQRRAHLKYVPLLGGEAAIRQPLRVLASQLWAAHPAAEALYSQVFRRFTVEELRVLRKQFETGFNAPLTSSCGRLFDAVSALLRVCDQASYEGQPAVELEAVADPRAIGCYAYEINKSKEGFIIDPALTLSAIWRDYRAGVLIGAIAGRFHNTVASWTADVCKRIRTRSGINTVCLSGGCFQNALLTERTRAALLHAGFRVYTHAQVPANDGGISLGQAVVAYASTR